MSRNSNLALLPDFASTRDKRTLNNQSVGSETEGESGNGLRRLFVIIIAVLGVILIGEVVFHLAIAPRMQIRSVAINADEFIPLGNEEILALSGLSGSSSYFEIDPAVVEQSLETYPLIKAAKVSRGFPNKLTITVTGREPLALVLAQIDGRTVPACIDEEEVVFQIGTGVDDLDLPVVSGFTFSDLQLGVKLPREIQRCFTTLSELKISSPLLFGLISEIRFMKMNDVEFEILLYLANYGVPVRTNPEINEDFLRNIVLLLDVAKRQGMLSYLEELDLRTGSAVYRMREE